MATTKNQSKPRKKLSFEHLAKVPAGIARRNKANLKAVRDKLFNFKEGQKPVIQRVKPMNVGDFLQERVTAAPHVLSSVNRASFTNWAKDKLAAINGDFASEEDADKAKVVRDYMGGLLTAARSGDDQSWKTLAAIIRVNTGYLLQGSGKWAQFFDMRMLNHNDRVYLHNEVPSEIKVDVIGEDGMADTVQPLRQKNVEFVTMFRLASDVFETICVDLYDGFDAKDAALQSINIGRDLEAKIDELIQAFILPGTAESRVQATFKIAGVGGIVPATADFVPHSRVNVANLPTGNLITLSDTNTATSSFRLDVIKAARAYCAAWGSGAFGDMGDIKIEAIYVPSSDATDLDDSFQATTASNALNDQFVGKPYSAIEYNGDIIMVIADNTLDPDDGICYVRTNRPIGILYDKPELSESLHWGKHTQDQYLVQNNLERFQEIRVLGVAMPRTWRIGALAVQYRDPA